MSTQNIYSKHIVANFNIREFNAGDLFYVITLHEQVELVMKWKGDGSYQPARTCWNTQGPRKSQEDKELADNLIDKSRAINSIKMLTHNAGQTPTLTTSKDKHNPPKNI